MTAPRETHVNAMRPPLPRLESLIVLGALALIVVLAWLYLALVGMDMTAGQSSPMADMPGMDMASGSSAALSFGLLAAMWIVMMVGMMLPSASPMILMMVRIDKERRGRGSVAGFATGAFVLAYGLVWTGFSLVAAAIEVGLHEGVLAGHDMAIGSGPIAGGILIAAGLYQWTPFKHLCLAKCRSPIGFLMSRWRPGWSGALAMGTHHGLYCLGCCWLLMALLFVAGVMALPWVAALAGLVLIEKLAPRGDQIARAGGVAMLGAGLYLIIAS